MLAMEHGRASELRGSSLEVAGLAPLGIIPEIEFQGEHRRLDSPLGYRFLAR